MKHAEAGMQTREGRYSVVAVRDAWYVACRSEELREKPFACRILDQPLVFYRDHQGQATALLDRCAHRNVPLSLGWVKDSRLVCGYHGWAFDRHGVCKEVPALCGEHEAKARRVPCFLTCEQQGFVWVYMNPDTEPKCAPFSFPLLDDRRYHAVSHQAQFTATLHASLENILDVPHTAFLHRRLFRGNSRHQISAIIRRFHDRAEVEYLDEPRPSGWIGRLLAPKGGTLKHFDRFFLPSIAQVEYQLGERSHLIATSALTPIDDFTTNLHAMAVFRTPLPAFLLKTFGSLLGRAVLAQDQKMLAAQSQAVQHFGGEQFASTEVDVLGPQIWRLLRQAERGDLSIDAEVVEQRISLLA